MKDLARRVWLVTFGALVSFVLYETIKTLLFPRMSVIVSHVVTVMVVAVLTFFVSRYALTRYGAVLAEVERQTKMSEETNRLLAGVLATMREGVLIVDANLRVVLYNDAATRVVKLPQKASTNGSPRAATTLAGDDSLSRAASSLPMTAPLFRLIDATRDPAINDAFRQALDKHASVETRVEMTGVEPRCYQLNVAPLGSMLFVGVFFDITQLERLERV